MASKVDVRDILNDKNSVVIYINNQKIKLKEEEFIEMALINNAVQNGFSVKKLTNGFIEFKNKNFTKKFIEKNMDISMLLKKN